MKAINTTIEEFVKVFITFVFICIFAIVCFNSLGCSHNRTRANYIQDTRDYCNNIDCVQK
jgi:hypothetical protein